ncbi:MAG: pyridoxine 5'-phosphate synthase [Candidatus Pelagibacter sp.]|nr:pyridoxine 5'-phosphate synthase [Candidatus Pelagibacter sp.]|tara:strand:+ start:279 stop:998 length:720 start_codon:yes stop_codon:yes gene_type:complete
MRRLGVNIDHIATLRNARGEKHPDLLKAAKLITSYGADSITLHLREDRRHIKDSDVAKICKQKKISVNLEMAANDEILKIALKNKPKYVCIVPEKRNEITTEGGLNLIKNKNKIKKIINKLKRNKIRTSLFINPSIKDINLSKTLETECIELHTGKLSNLIKSKKKFLKEFNKIKRCSTLANNLGLEVHAGHGMDYKTTKILSKIKVIKEFNIGHFIIGESIFLGLKKIIKKFRILSNR